MSESFAQALSQSASTNPLLWIAGVLIAGELLSRFASRLMRGRSVLRPKVGRDCPHCVACRGRDCSGRTTAA